MNADQLLDTLGYSRTRAFLDATRWHEASEHAHALEHTASACAGPRVRGSFRGVYMIGVGSDAWIRATTPVVLVCEAPDARAADAIHRLTWNQSVAPFLIVHTPVGVRLYSGFDYEAGDPSDSGPRRGLLDACVAFEAVAQQLDAFRADRIDDGTIWREWGKQVDPTRRVDGRLLDSLTALSERLIEDAEPAEKELRRKIAHALIGRFVYLRYLRDREILTDARLRSWNLDPQELFCREVRTAAFHELGDRLGKWLNGSIFPLPKTGKGAPRVSDIQLVAGTLLGDDAPSGQLHLAFRAYDFSHIPIELLSSIYERFMAVHKREDGVYYTPIPLVNFVLGELDDLHPLRHGMRIFDPSCGSGAFLVQCYQLLILRRRQQLGRSLTPSELRDLLTEHIFGLDREGGACRVTEFSLDLALLDQIPTDTLASLDDFKLPNLHNVNIFEQDFFDTAGPWRAPEGGYAWIVGNPPWAKASSTLAKHRPVLEWIAEHAKTEPVCGKEIAEAFAWKAADHLGAGGVVAFAMPAMSLFVKQKDFRASFLARMDVKAVANLANLRRVLFGRRAEHPCAIFFYTRREGLPEPVHVYSPMVANQEAGRPARAGEQRPIWSITVNHSEIRVLEHDDIAHGETLPWKICMWGSSRDLRLLRTLERRFPSLGDLEGDRFALSEGLQLRNRAAEEAKPPEKQESLERLREVVNKYQLSLDTLADASHVHTFPSSALTKVQDADGYVRPGRGELPLRVCRPPHLIISAARTFAVFSDKFLVVPPRHVGLAGTEKDSAFLKALALYLGSRFVRYHQFFLSPQEGIRGGRSTLDVLRKVPIPFAGASEAALRPWVRLHRELTRLSDLRWANPDDEADLCKQIAPLEAEVDRLAFEALGLRPYESFLVQDFIDVRRALIDGKVGKAAIAPPTARQVKSYALTLRDCLDAYLDRGERYRHRILAVLDATAGAVEIAFDAAPTPHRPRVEQADDETATHLRRVREQIDRSRGQWLYHDRNMTMYFDDRAYVFKPMQRLWWTRSQALADADRIIADLVADGGQA